MYSLANAPLDNTTVTLATSTRRSHVGPRVQSQHHDARRHVELQEPRPIRQGNGRRRWRSGPLLRIGMPITDAPVPVEHHRHHQLVADGRDDRRATEGGHVPGSTSTARGRTAATAQVDAEYAFPTTPSWMAAIDGYNRNGFLLGEGFGEVQVNGGFVGLGSVQLNSCVLGRGEGAFPAP